MLINRGASLDDNNCRQLQLARQKANNCQIRMPKCKISIQALTSEPPDGEDDYDDYDSEADYDEEDDDEDAYAPAHRGCTCARCLRSAGPPRESGESHINSIYICLKEDAYRCQNADRSDQLTDEQHYEQAYTLWLRTNDNSLEM